MDTNDNLEQEINNIKDFHSQLFSGDENSKSIQDEIEALKSSIFNSDISSKEKLKRIQSYYNELFENTETRNSIETEIGTLYKNLFEDTEEKKSVKSEINALFNKIKSDYNLFVKQNADVTKFHNKLFEGDENEDSIEYQIDEFYDKLFMDNDETKSLKTQFDILLKNLNDRFKVSEEKIKKLETFYSTVFDDQTDSEGKVVKTSLINSINSQKNRLDNLIKEANQKLYALTDSSLHNAFAKRAEEYTTEFRRLEGITHKLTWAVIADIAIFGIIQLIVVLVTKKFDYHLLIYQFSIAGALVFAIWMFNRNQKIAKKLAEEYHHKAAIAEAMTGYRQLYDLEHEDGEYMELFNSLKDQLNVNPSKSIDKFLNLKSPQEEVTESVKNTFSPDKLKELAEALKPLLRPD